MEDNLKNTNPVKAIREKCIDCVCGQIKEVELCPAESCALYPFRMGKNPYRKTKTITAEQREKMRVNLEMARAKKQYINS